MTRCYNYIQLEIKKMKSNFIKLLFFYFLKSILDQNQRFVKNTVMTLQLSVSSLVTTINFSTTTKSQIMRINCVFLN